MISHLKGLLFKKSPESIIIDIHGVGYEVIAPLSTFYAMPEENEEASLFIHTHVREDAFTLFGFQTTLEKDIFRLLISVSGIGPKLGVNILSGIGPMELLGAIAHRDAAKLQTIPGVGKKTAERMILELKDKAEKLGVDLELPSTQVVSRKDEMILKDALSALQNLGYSTKPAKSAIEKALAVQNNASLEWIIREALRLLA